MKYTDCLSVAWYNITHKKRFYIRLFLNLLFMTVSVMLWLSVLSALSVAHNSYLYGAASDNVMYFDINRSDDHTNDNYDAFCSLNAMDETMMAAASAKVDLPKYLHQDGWSFVNIKYAEMVVNRKHFQGENDYSYYFEREYDRRELPSKYSVPLHLAVTTTPALWTDNELTEYRFKAGRNTPLLAGSAELHDGKLVISDYMLQRFGIRTEHWDDLIGQHISILCEGTTILEDYEITGVLDSNLFHVDALKDSPQIFISESDAVCSQFDITAFSYRLPIDGYENTDTVLRAANEIESYGWDYILEYLSEYYAFIAHMQTIVRKIGGLFGIAILSALSLMFYQAFSRYFSDQRSWYGMLSAVGMERRNLHTIILSELGFLLLFVFITAAVTARLLLILISQAMYSLIGTALTLNATQTAGILFISLAVLLCLISLVTFLNMRSLRRKSAAELMKS